MVKQKTHLTRKTAKGKTNIRPKKIKKLNKTKNLTKLTKEDFEKIKSSTTIKAYLQEQFTNDKALQNEHNDIKEWFQAIILDKKEFKIVLQQLQESNDWEDEYIYNNKRVQTMELLNIAKTTFSSNWSRKKQVYKQQKVKEKRKKDQELLQAKARQKEVESRVYSCLDLYSQENLEKLEKWMQTQLQSNNQIDEQTNSFDLKQEAFDYANAFLKKMPKTTKEFKPNFLNIVKQLAAVFYELQFQTQVLTNEKNEAQEALSLAQVQIQNMESSQINSQLQIRKINDAMIQLQETFGSFDSTWQRNIQQYDKDYLTQNNEVRKDQKKTKEQFSRSRKYLNAFYEWLKLTFARNVSENVPFFINNSILEKYTRWLAQNYRDYHDGKMEQYIDKSNVKTPYVGKHSTFKKVVSSITAFLHYMGYTHISEIKAPKTGIFSEKFDHPIISKRHLSTINQFCTQRIHHLNKLNNSKYNGEIAVLLSLLFVGNTGCRPNEATKAIKGKKRILLYKDSYETQTLDGVLPLQYIRLDESLTKTRMVYNFLFHESQQEFTKLYSQCLKKCSKHLQDKTIKTNTNAINKLLRVLREKICHAKVKENFEEKLTELKKERQESAQRYTCKSIRRQYATVKIMVDKYRRTTGKQKCEYNPLQHTDTKMTADVYASVHAQSWEKSAKQFRYLYKEFQLYSDIVHRQIESNRVDYKVPHDKHYDQFKKLVEQEELLVSSKANESDDESEDESDESDESEDEINITVNQNNANSQEDKKLADFSLKEKIKDQKPKSKSLAIANKSKKLTERRQSCPILAKSKSIRKDKSKTENTYKNNRPSQRRQSCPAMPTIKEIDQSNKALVTRSKSKSMIMKRTQKKQFN